MTAPKGEAVEVSAPMDERRHNSRGRDHRSRPPRCIWPKGRVTCGVGTTVQDTRLGPALFVLRVDLPRLALDVLCVQRTWSIAQA